MSASHTDPSAKQVKQLLNLLDGITRDQFQSLLGAGDLIKLMAKVDLSQVDREAFAALLATSAPAPTIGEPYDLTIDYSMPLEAMVAEGHFDYADPNITEKNFPVVPGEAKVEALLVNFGRHIKSDEAIALVAPQGYRPAVTAEQAAFGAQHPELQRQHPIVALGSVWTDVYGHRRVGGLWGNSGLRRFGLDWYDGEWFPDYWFLFVREVSAL